MSLKSIIEKDPKLKERFDQVYWSIYLYNLSLSELRIISDVEYNQSELKILNFHTFNFYRVTLQYCFVMEYNKILEKGRKYKSQNISSVIQLNQIIFSRIGESFCERYSENIELIETIKSSKFFKKIRNLRDKKLAHADDNVIYKPFNVKGFKEEDFTNGFNHLKALKIVLINLTSPFDFEYDLHIPNREDRTMNFIKFHAKYKDFYFKNSNFLK